ncbi:MAG: SRPBCC domain-containing protein [Caulobacterales bacterium]|jgi:uncharacterized protein YndB with AHSA1/START domain
MTDAVVVALRVRADPARTFAVFTEEIALWWRPNAMFAATPLSPGRLAFEPGPNGRLVEHLANGKAFEIGRVRVWEPPHRLVFGWRAATFAPDMDGEVEVTFQPVGAETRVSVTHRGWLKVPQSHVARHGIPDRIFLQRYGVWWTALLAAMAGATQG